MCVCRLLAAVCVSLLGVSLSVPYFIVFIRCACWIRLTLSIYIYIYIYKGEYSMFHFNAMEWGANERCYWCCFVYLLKSICCFIHKTKSSATHANDPKMLSNGIVHMVAEGEIFKNVCICPSHWNAHTKSSSQPEIFVNIDTDPDLSSYRMCTPKKKKQKQRHKAIIEEKKQPTLNMFYGNAMDFNFSVCVFHSFPFVYFDIFIVR